MKNKEKCELAQKENAKNSLYSVQKVCESIESISNEMDEICRDKDPKNTFSNQKRMDLLEKNGNFKIKMLSVVVEARKVMMEEKATEPTPIKVEFVSPDTMEEKDRIARLEEEVDISMGKGGKA